MVGGLVLVPPADGVEDGVGAALAEGKVAREVGQLLGVLQRGFSGGERGVGGVEGVGVKALCGLLRGLLVAGDVGLRLLDGGFARGGVGWEHGGVAARPRLATLAAHAGAGGAAEGLTATEGTARPVILFDDDGADVADVAQIVGVEVAA